jgi:hypothetical protein
MSPKNSTVKREATSIKIRPDVWKEAKIEAIKQDMDLSELVEKAIELYMNREDAKFSKRVEK